MTKEVQIRICIGLIAISLVALVAGEGLFRGLYIFTGFALIGALYLAISYWLEA